MLVGVDVPIDGLSQWAGMAAEAAVKLGKAMTPIALEAGQERVEKKTAEEKHKALVEKVLNDNSDVGKEELVENPTSMPIAPMKNTEFFIDILLLIRSLQVGAALSRVLEDKSALAAPAPLSNAERVNISGCRLLLPDALNSPRMALALHATSKPFTDAAARFLLRGGVSAASEAGIAFMTGGISLFVSASLKAAKGPTAGSLVSDIIIDSPTTSRNMAMVNFFQQQFDQIAQELAPFYAKRPACNVAITPGKTVGIFWELPSKVKTAYLGAKNKNSWAMDQLLEAAGGFGISPQGCESWVALAHVLDKAIRDTYFLASIAYEAKAASYAGVYYAEKALESVFISNMSFTDPREYEHETGRLFSADYTSWLGAMAQPAEVQVPISKDLGVWFKHAVAPSFEKKR